MRFLSPMAFVFAATIPVVVVFYLLKRRRTTRIVPSTLLWQRFLAETQASSPFQRLRHNWLLVLQVLLLLLAVMALARPYFGGELSSGRLQVVILDASASMRATDGKPTRFESAKVEALKLVAGLRDRDQMVVVQAGGFTEVRQSPTSLKSALRRAIEACSPSDAPTRLADALKLAETLTKDAPAAEIHLLSDGAAADLGEFDNKGLRIIYHRMGERGNNAAIVSMDVRGHPDDPTKRMVFATVANFSSNAVQTVLELRLEGTVLEARSLSLEARGSSPQVFTAQQGALEAIFTARLDLADDLLVDNEASVVSQLPRPVRALLVTPGNGFLEKALRSNPHVRLEVAPSLGVGKLDADVVVLDGVAPTVWPEVSMLAFRSARPGWFTNAIEAEVGGIVDWKPTHPLLRSVGLENIQIAKALVVKAPSWALNVVDAAQTPLVLAGEFQRHKVIWVGFDVYQSTWPLRVSFPIFIANALEWLSSGAAGGASTTMRTGDPLRLAVLEGLSAFEVTLPDQSKRSIKLEPGSRDILFGDTGRAGVYKVQAGALSARFALNISDPAESDIWPRDELRLGKHAGVGTTTLKRADLEAWRWIAAMGLGVLLWEWWYYHRRSV